MWYILFNTNFHQCQLCVEVLKWFLLLLEIGFQYVCSVPSFEVTMMSELALTLNSSSCCPSFPRTAIICVCHHVQHM